MKAKIKSLLGTTAYIVLLTSWGLYALSGLPLPSFLSHVPVVNVVASGFVSLTGAVLMIWQFIHILKNE